MQESKAEARHAQTERSAAVTYGDLWISIVSCVVRGHDQELR